MKKYIALILAFVLLACLVGCKPESQNKFEIKPAPVGNGLYFSIKEIVYDEEYKCHKIVVNWHNPTDKEKGGTCDGYDIEYLNGNAYESVFKLDESTEWIEDYIRLEPNEAVERSYALNEKLFDLTRKGTYRIKISYYIEVFDWGTIEREYSELYAEFIIS